MSVLTPEVIDILMKLSCPLEEKTALMKALVSAGQAFQVPAGLSGTTGEQERIRNASTYAERKRKKDRERQARLREEARLQKEQAKQSRDIDGDIARHRATSTATEGDTSRDTGDAAPSRTCAQVVVLSSSSLRSEEGKEPTSSNEDVPPLRVAKPNGFARFWEAYPNKVGKTAAEAAYAKALKRITGPDPPAVLLAGVERAKASRAWADGYIPHPTTWLRQGRWDDEPADVHPETRKANGQRPHPDKLSAKQANYARAFAGSESAALRRREH